MAKQENTLLSGERLEIPLNQLFLDQENPRFGDLSTSASQADILDLIVEKFGVDDVLSSLAVNGYFNAEPLVCRKSADGKRFTVVEGNRRLSACLILTGDSRASHQSKRTVDYKKIWENHGKNQIDPVPVIAFNEDEQEKEILSYLGVRHIASSQPWDSYAKASWVARVIEKSKLPLADVAMMIGDQHKTIARLLEGYYFVKQLEETGHFRPSDSVRKGRGSVSAYPFSWVYTMLGYSSTRKFLELKDASEPSNYPIPKANLNKAALVTKSMFGDAPKGRNAAITDSRELGDLASALSSPEKVSMLESGKSLDEIERATKPIDERLRQGLAEVREIQGDLLKALGEQQITPELADPLLSLSTINRRASTDIEKKLRSITEGESDLDG